MPGTRVGMAPGSGVADKLQPELQEDRMGSTGNEQSLA